MSTRTRGMAKGDEEVVTLDAIQTLLQRIKDIDGIKKITDPVVISAILGVITGVVTVNDLLRGLTDPPTGTIARRIDFTWNADATVATMLYRDGSGGLLFTLTFTYVAGNVTSIVRT